MQQAWPCSAKTPSGPLHHSWLRRQLQRMRQQPRQLLCRLVAAAVVLGPVAQQPSPRRCAPRCRLTEVQQGLLLTLCSQQRLHRLSPLPRILRAGCNRTLWCTLVHPCRAPLSLWHVEGTGTGGSRGSASTSRQHHHTSVQLQRGALAAMPSGARLPSAVTAMPWALQQIAAMTPAAAAAAGRLQGTYTVQQGQLPAAAPTAAGATNSIGAWQPAASAGGLQQSAALLPESTNSSSWLGLMGLGSLMQPGSLLLVAPARSTAGGSTFSRVADAAQQGSPSTIAQQQQQQQATHSLSVAATAAAAGMPLAFGQQPQQLRSSAGSWWSGNGAAAWPVPRQVVMPAATPMLPATAAVGGGHNCSG